MKWITYLFLAAIAFSFFTIGMRYGEMQDRDRIIYEQ